MTAIELQNYIHVYSMFSFRDGRKEPGLLISKYNTLKSDVEYFFIPQGQMQAYKNAFDRYDRETCNTIAQPVDAHEIHSIRPVSLSDYKMILQLLHERNQQLQHLR